MTQRPLLLPATDDPIAQRPSPTAHTSAAQLPAHTAATPAAQLPAHAAATPAAQPPAALTPAAAYLSRRLGEILHIRRRLHQLAELSTLEYATGSYIRSLLDSWHIPYEYPVADTGLTAAIQGKKPGPGRTVALRADMDALPIFEEGRSPFASQNPGVMHACGHDAHMAIALGAARYFKEQEESFSGCVRIFFQPAEETIGGAARMIEAGCMERPPVDFVTGLHVAPQLPAGDIEVKYDKMYAASDEVSLVLLGQGGHGAYPESGVDAIVLAASVIASLQTLVSRRVSPLDQCVLSFGTIRGGSAHNVLADRVELTGALRTTDPATRALAKEYITQQMTQIAAAYGGSGRAVFTPGYDALVNTNSLVDLLRETAIPLLGREHVRWKEAPGMGVEDFSAFLQKAPGVFYHLGCGYPSARADTASNPFPTEKREDSLLTSLTKNIPSFAPLHSRAFSLNEDCLAVGVRLQIALTEALLALLFTP